MALFSVKKNEHPKMRLFACPDSKYFSLWVLVSSGILALWCVYGPSYRPYHPGPTGVVRGTLSRKAGLSELASAQRL